MCVFVGMFEVKIFLPGVHSGLYGGGESVQYIAGARAGRGCGADSLEDQIQARRVKSLG